MLTYILFTIFILACVVLIISVLLQPGKSDAGALFTSSISSTAFGPRGTQTILAKITIGAAATFIIVALLLGMGVGGQRSLMEGAKSKASPTPAPPPAQQGEAATPATTQTEGGSTTNAAATPASGPESKASPTQK